MASDSRSEYRAGKEPGNEIRHRDTMSRRDLCDRRQDAWDWSKAIDRFDTGYNVMFSTYAVPMIMGEIQALYP